MTLSRRGLLASSLGLVGCAAAPPLVTERPAAGPAPQPPSPPRGIDATTFAEAEKLVDFGPTTAAERELMAGAFADQLDLLRGLHRGLPDAPPATVFRPGPVPAGKRSVTPFRVARAAPLPARDVDIAFASVMDQARWLRSGQLTSERLTSIYLERLERHGPRLECVVTLCKDQALAQARAADAELRRGKPRSWLTGIPYGAKDLLDSKDIPTSWGVALYKDRKPARSAVVIERLEAAGAVLLAKLSLGELANTDVWYGGITRNPWNPDEGSEGSSAGSGAAVAAGLCSFALGSETLGSIVAPAMRCGCVGLRPTFGRVARTGAMTLCWSLDKLGPLARRVEDALLVLQVIDGADPGDPASVDAALAYDSNVRLPRRLKIGWLESQHELERSARSLLEKLGHELVPLQLPELPYDSMVLILLAEAAAAFDQLGRSGQDDTLRQQTAHAWPNQLRLARFISAVDLVQADRVRRQVMDVMARIFQQVDVIAGPSFDNPMLAATNASGHPSITIPIGLERKQARGWGVEPMKPEGPEVEVPHGMTLWGRLYDEGTLCRVADGLEHLLPSGARPPQFSS